MNDTAGLVFPGLWREFAIRYIEFFDLGQDIGNQVIDGIIDALHYINDFSFGHWVDLTRII